MVITNDSSEADLKQRAEVQDGTVLYQDQPPVLAAIHGRVLVIEGIEKAERNVLPTLNNLLENREMALTDGRFLVSSERYDALLKNHDAAELERKQLVRVHQDFRVFALGLPVPRYPGFALDPPLRSRFQARVVEPLGLHEQISTFATKYPSVQNDLLTRLVSFRETLRLIEDGSRSS